MVNRIKYIVTTVLCVHLFTSNITVSHSLPNVTKLEKNKQQVDHCDISQFQCKNAQCISKAFVCDGLKHCQDGSDETYDQCRKNSSMKCDERHFQCNYGACIEKKYKCDGLKQCLDGSDESSDLCKALGGDELNEADESCALFASSIDKTVNFSCNGNFSKTCEFSNGYVPELNKAKVTCTAGYYKENKGDSPGHAASILQVHICYNKKWIPPITKCLKKCDKLNPVNVILQCYRNGVKIDNCDENSVLLAGTKVRSSCKLAYRYYGHPSYSEITCNDQGKWDNILLPCIPECGKPLPPSTANLLIAPGGTGGSQAELRSSPWHVAIFNKERELICGGTIISANLVLSAAHCFSDDSDSCEGTVCADDFQVVISKYTRNYNYIDNEYQKALKIKEIRFSEKGYHGMKTRHTADLAIIILKDPIPISPAVLPACINWEDLKHHKYPSEDEPGKIVGWGVTETGRLSHILMSFTLPFISYRRCVGIVDSDFIPFLTFDKFCAGTRNRTGSTLLQGDSGGGILFEDKGLFYLRGVVSVKQTSSNAVTLFTDLAEHVDWISSVRDSVEKNLPMIKIANQLNIHQDGSNLEKLIQSVDSLNRRLDDLETKIQQKEAIFEKSTYKT